MPGKANAPTRNGVATSPPTSPSSSRERREFDPDDPDYIKDLQRPAVIKVYLVAKMISFFEYCCLLKVYVNLFAHFKEDLNEMERRKRVRQILESKAFREELETLIVNERQQGNNAENLHTLEQLSELILPRSGQGLQQMTSSTTGAFGEQFSRIFNVFFLDSIQFAINGRDNSFFFVFFFRFFSRCCAYRRYSRRRWCQIHEARTYASN